MWGIKMGKINRILSIILCAILLFQSSITGMAKQTQLYKAFVTVGLSDGSIRGYQVIVRENEIYISAGDLAEITGYKYIEDDCIEFEKNDYNLMEKVFIDFSGDAEVSRKKYKLDVLRIQGIYYIPLEKTLYLLRANWKVKNDIVYINPMTPDILDFLYLYWDEINNSKSEIADLFINKEYSGTNNFTDSFWNSLAHMTRDFDSRLYIPGGAVKMVQEEYEEALMQLNENDQQFLGEEGQKNIEKQLEESELDILLTQEGAVDKFVKIPEKADSLSEFLDKYEKENTVARKISNVIDKSEIKDYKMTDLSEICDNISNTVKIVNAVLNVMEISSWGNQMDEEFLRQLSIIEEINDKKIYSGWALNRMKDAARDLRKRKENKSEMLVYDSWKEAVKTIVDEAANLTPTGKLVSSIQMLDSINGLTESGLNKVMKAKTLSYSIRYFLNLEQMTEIESIKRYGDIFVNKKLNTQTIQEMRSIILMRLRVNLRTQSMIYKLNQMERKDKESWEKSTEARNIMQHIERDYALITELHSTEKADKRIPQNSLKNIYCDEDGLVKEKISLDILKKKKVKEKQADNAAEVFQMYQNACKELVNKGRWKEELYAEIEAQMKNSGSKQKTSGSLYYDMDISGYRENDLSNLRLDGHYSCEIANMFYNIALQYSNGNLHVEQTSPTEETYDIETDPEEIAKMDYITITNGNVTNIQKSGDTISFTVPEDFLNKKGNELSTLIQGMTNISYTDMNVVAEIDEEENRLYNIKMVFSVNCNYQGYDTTIHYNTNYSLDSEEN